MLISPSKQRRGERLSIFDMGIRETCGPGEPDFDEVESYYGTQREPAVTFFSFGNGDAPRIRT
jgi:hypothetical protein